MRKLSAREKVLIYIAVLLMVLSGGYYYIFVPAYGSYEEALALKEQMNLELSLAERRVVQIIGLEHKYEEEKKIFDTKDYQNEGILSYEELEDIVLSHVETYGVNVDSVKISKSAMASGVEDEDQSFLELGSIKIQTSGSFEKFCQILNDIARTKNMKVASFRMIEQDGKNHYVIDLTVEYGMIGNVNEE